LIIQGEWHGGGSNGVVPLRRYTYGDGDDACNVKNNGIDAATGNCHRNND
jgi:hypothetical protein